MKKKGIIIFFTMIMVLGCMTGCKKPPDYASSSRTIKVSISGYLTTKNVEFWDFFHDVYYDWADGKHAIPAGLSGTEITFIDEDVVERTVRVSTPIIKSDESYTSSFTMYTDSHCTKGHIYKKK